MTATALHPGPLGTTRPAQQHQSDVLPNWWHWAEPGHTYKTLQTPMYSIICENLIEDTLAYQHTVITVITASLLDNSKSPTPQSTPDEHSSDAATTWVICRSHLVSIGEAKLS